MTKQVIKASLTLTIENGGAELAKFIRERLSGAGLVWYGDSYMTLGQAFAEWLAEDLIIPPTQASDDLYDQWADANIGAKFELIA